MTRRNGSLQKIRAATMPRDSFHFSSSSRLSYFLPSQQHHHHHARTHGRRRRRGEGRLGRVILVDVGRFLTNILERRAGKAKTTSFGYLAKLTNDGGGGAE